MLKTYSQAMGLETFRVSKAEALEKAEAAEFDLLPSMLVKVDRPLPHAHQTKQVRYRVHLEGGDPAGVFVTGPTQAVKSIDPHTAEITVYAIRPGRADGNGHAPADPPTDDDLRPEQLIQSDDPLIVADAEEGGRRRDRSLARGGGLGALRQPRSEGRRISRRPSPRRPRWPNRGKATAPSTPCSWPRCAAPGASPPAWPSGWSTCKAAMPSAITCGRKCTSRSDGFPIDATLGPRRHRGRPPGDRPQQSQRRLGLQRLFAGGADSRAAEDRDRRGSIGCEIFVGCGSVPMPLACGVFHAPSLVVPQAVIPRS